MYSMCCIKLSKRKFENNSMIKYYSLNNPSDPYFAFNLAFFIVLMDFIKIAVFKLKLADFISNFDN